jgi:hypothetical protein
MVQVEALGPAGGVSSVGFAISIPAVKSIMSMNVLVSVPLKVMATL